MKPTVTMPLRHWPSSSPHASHVTSTCITCLVSFANHFRLCSFLTLILQTTQLHNNMPGLPCSSPTT
jgi:hypothetical protein